MRELPLFCEASLPESKLWIQKLASEVLREAPSEPGALYLNYTPEGLVLHEVGPLKPLRVDFVEGELRHKRKQGIGKGSLVGKALGLSKGYRKIFDATLGLGGDSFMFLCMGLQVEAVEKSKPVFMLTKDALERAEADEELKVWINQRLQIKNQDAHEALNDRLTADIIYFDFMFPEKKKALPRKSMQLLAKLDLEEDSEKDLVKKAKAQTVARVVVKRPLKAPPVLENRSHTFEGNSIRYDVYLGQRRS